MKDHERFRWMMEVLEVKPNDSILEVGCGVGLAAEQVIPVFKKGKITAIDRSKTMIDKAIRRNAESIKKDKARFLTLDLLQFSGELKAYNKIFAFNVNLFWTQRTITKEAEIIRSHLSKNGLLYVFYGPMFAGWSEKIVNPVRENLEQEEFNVLDVLHQEELRCCCIIARSSE